jgi:hypothetical protein
MKQSGTFSVVTGVLVMAALATPRADAANTVTFDNQTGKAALVKLVGPTAMSVAVATGQKETVELRAGHYFIKTRLGTAGNYVFSKGDEFDVIETSTAESRITITLHTVVGGNYGTQGISQKEFDGEDKQALSFSLPEQYADIKAETFGLPALIELAKVFPDRDSEVGRKLGGKRMAPDIGKMAPNAEPDLLNDFAGLRNTSPFLEKYPRPWTVSKVITWYCSSADDRERICFLKVLAQVRDARATYVVGEALEWDGSVLVRLATCALVTSFCQPSSNSTNVEMVKAATSWWTTNKDRLAKELKDK